MAVILIAAQIDYSIIWCTHDSYCVAVSGHFCPNNTEFAEQYPCPNGTFNNVTNGQDINVCELCTPGSYCPTMGLPEPAGFCAPGWYCTLGSWSNQPTPLGNDTGSSCECPAQTIGGMCVAGEYCPAGASTPIPCNPGKTNSCISSHMNPTQNHMTHLRYDAVS